MTNPQLVDVISSCRNNSLTVNIAATLKRIPHFHISRDSRIDLSVYTSTLLPYLSVYAPYGAREI